MNHAARENTIMCHNEPSIPYICKEMEVCRRPVVSCEVASKYSAGGGNITWYAPATFRDAVATMSIRAEAMALVPIVTLIISACALYSRYETRG